MLRIARHVMMFVAAALLIYSGLFAPWPDSVEVFAKVVAGILLIGTGGMILLVELRSL